MEIDDTTYDIDNIDIEEEMNTADIEQEEEQEQEEFEKKEAEKFEKEVKTKRLQLTRENLDADLQQFVEDDRKRYKFVDKNGNKYFGFVIYKFDRNNFVFSVREINASTYVSKKFNIDELKQIK